jgi:hypothetical protein
LRHFFCNNKLAVAKAAVVGGLALPLPPPWEPPSPPRLEVEEEEGKRGWRRKKKRERGLEEEEGRSPLSWEAGFATANWIVSFLYVIVVIFFERLLCRFLLNIMNVFDCCHVVSK